MIGLDGVVQQPITFTSIAHTLNSNISANTTQFVLSGIGSIQPSDVLKINDEYMKIEQVGFSSTPTGTINDATDVAQGLAILPVVKVETLKNETVPKSDKHSIATKDKPATIAGLAEGSIILKKLSFAVKPKFLLTSIRLLD